MNYKKFLPNILSSFRLASVPYIVACPQNHRIWLLFFIALTDFFDGYLARRWNVISAFGTIVDPIADKAVAVTFASMCWSEGLVSNTNLLMFFSREIAEVLFIAFAHFTNLSKPTSPFWSGKVATTVQALIALFWSLSQEAPQALYILMALCGLSACIELVWKSRKKVQIYLQ